MNVKLFMTNMQFILVNTPIYCSEPLINVVIRFIYYEFDIQQIIVKV